MFLFNVWEALGEQVSFCYHNSLVVVIGCVTISRKTCMPIVALKWPSYCCGNWRFFS